MKLMCPFAMLRKTSVLMEVSASMVWAPLSAAFVVMVGKAKLARIMSMNVTGIPA